jgi:hypothetical protein
MSILKAIENQFKRMEERRWDKIYYFFDLHETVLYPDYDNKHPLKMYPHAKEVLQHLSKRKDISISIYTCSYPIEIDKYIKFFKKNKIEFEYINKNPDVDNTTYGFYDDKPYFNVLFEDKAGFDAEEDWVKVAGYFGLLNHNVYFDNTLITDNTEDNGNI